MACQKSEIHRSRLHVIRHKDTQQTRRHQTGKGAGGSLKPAVLIPVKAGGLKSRLAPSLDARQRQKLAELMLRDVLDAVAVAGLISTCFVITSSRSIQRLAERTGANAIVEDSDRGVNSAVDDGLERTEAKELMVIPSDLPLLKPSEIREALRLKASGMDIVVTPSMDFDGTNLLTFSKERPLTLSFDRDSFWNHLADASSRHYRVAVYSGKGVRFDVDTVHHLEQLAVARSGGRAVLFAKKAWRR